MPTPPPVPPAERSPYGPEGVPKTSEDVSHRVRHAAERHERDLAETGGARPPVDVIDALRTSPWLKLAGAAAAGYVLGALVHAGPGRSAPPPPPPRPRPHTMPEPVVRDRSSVASEDRRSGVRFR